jgi:hypothetical protein
MTEFMNQDRLQQLGQVMDQPNLPLQGLVPSVQWTIDMQTGRPVGRWVLTRRSRNAGPDIRSDR